MAATPIQIVPLHPPALAPVAKPRLTYRGGPILGSVQVFVFYWGDAWSKAPQQTMAAQLDAFFDFVLQSRLMDQLTEYDTPAAAIGRGTRAGSATVAGAPPASLADADVQRFIQSQASSGASIPQPGPHNLYFVFLPPGVTVGMDGGASCVNFCGYHNAIAGRFFYAVMPFPDCGGCAGGLSPIDALTSTTSHELCEAITDPVPGQGWYDDRNGEIGDICAWRTKRLGGYLVQLEWSNRAEDCI